MNYIPKGEIKMAKTENKRQKVVLPAGIRNKLMAAISMLLVSCIMLVSSTYAWFVLSTAPEVTGITTNVGANGNLEMMLLNSKTYASSEANLGVESKVGDSSAAQDVEKANETWGNLVDLDSTTYGLDNIVLMPAKLNLSPTVSGEGDSQVITNGTTVASSMLLAPSYGSDGRVINVNTPTYNGTFSSGNFVYSNTAAGVRAIGTTSGVTIRLSAYRAALSSAGTAINDVKVATTKSLDENKEAFAEMMIGIVAGTSDYKEYLPTMEAVLIKLQEANDNAAIAIKNIVLAYNLSAANEDSLTDDAVEKMQSDIEKITTITATAFTDLGLDLPDGTTDAIASYTEVNTSLVEATAAYENIKNNTTVTESELSTVLNYVVDINKVSICNMTLETSKKDDIMLAVVNNGMTADIVFLNESGVYDSLADMCGTVTVNNIELMIDASAAGIGDPGSLVKAKANITTLPNVPGSLNTAVGKVQEKGAPSETMAEGVTVTLGDTYGYALDLGFRTNAASSDLLLQTAGVQRVYTEGTASSTTQGSGSYMEFKSADTDLFSVDEVRALMSAIRIAFVTPNSTSGAYEMLALAALDITGTYNESLGKMVYTGGEEVGEDGLKAGLYLYDFSQEADGDIVLGTKKADESVITNLIQNTAKKVTVIVYLDGNIVDNTMVANANESMSGSLNLQFSSSATLKPMENTGMRNGGVAAKGSTASQITYNVIAAPGATYTVGDYTGTVKSGFSIYEGSDGKKYYSADGATYVELTTSNALDVITVSQ